MYLLQSSRVVIQDAVLIRVLALVGVHGRRYAVDMSEKVEKGHYVNKCSSAGL